MQANSNSPTLADEILSGDELKLSQAATERNTDPSVVFRWVQRGLRNGRGERIRLEALRFGRNWLTSRAAIRRFFLAMEHSVPTPTAPIRTPSKREAAATRAEKALADQYGI